MSSIYLVLFFLAIVVIVYWAWQNDKVPLSEKTIGILRMTFIGARAGEDPSERGGPPPGAQGTSR